METKTAARMAKELRTIPGIEVTDHVGGTGVVGVMKNGAGPTVLVRADMDGLPLKEASGLTNASTVVQPAEERIGGAHKMLEDDLYTRVPKPDVALAFHVDADSPTGTIIADPGISSSSSDSIDITIHGVGGHGHRRCLPCRCQAQHHFRSG